MSGAATKGGGFDTAHWPIEIRLKTAEKTLEVDFDDGERFRLPAEYLRVESPSAEVQGHGGPATKKLVSGRRHVKIVNVEAVGNYAIRIVFDDGHSTGLYSWAYLHQLGCDHDPLWQDYLRRAGRA